MQTAKSVEQDRLRQSINASEQERRRWARELHDETLQGLGGLRILLSSAGILTALGAGALLVFAVVPGLVVGILFGPSFRDAIPLVFPVGLIGLALALDNLLVQFFMAVHDRVFVPILALAVLSEGVESTFGRRARVRR